MLNQYSFLAVGLAAANFTYFMTLIWLIFDNLISEKAEQHVQFNVTAIVLVHVKCFRTLQVLLIFS